MWGLAVAVVVSPSSRVFGDGLVVEFLGFNGCTRSRVGELEAAIFSTLLRTTASSVVRFSSCCRLSISRFSGSCRSRVFQGLRAPFSPVARGDW
ncbi:unnamed protein product [Brassica rapa subsp. trilocularis]